MSRYRQDPDTGECAAFGGMGASRRHFLMTAASLLAASGMAPAGLARALVAAPEPTLRAQRLAWAGIRLQLGKDALFLDPLLNPDVWGSALKDRVIPLDGVEGQRNVLVTHRHPDHFDPMAVHQALGDNGTLACTADAAAAAAALGIKVRVAKLYEPLLLGDFTATAVPASDGYGDEQVSWVVSAGGRRILHGGDTLWHGAWWQIGRQYGPFDAVFLPINGARFGWRKPVSDVPGVLTPEQAVAAAVVLGARLLVPIHYGVTGAEDYSEVAEPEAAMVQAARKRGVAVEIARPGEWLTWRPRD